MQTPKYNIGDTVYTASSAFEAPVCKECNQSIYNDDDKVSYVDKAEKHTVRGICIRESITDYPSGVSYQLYDDPWIRDEAYIHPTEEAALEALKVEQEKDV